MQKFILQESVVPDRVVQTINSSDVALEYIEPALRLPLMHEERIRATFPSNCRLSISYKGGVVSIQMDALPCGSNGSSNARPPAPMMSTPAI
jgi:hypothetical protein